MPKQNILDNKVAIFGGSFDPIHLGHVSLAKYCQKNTGIKKIIFMPCYKSPHKVEDKIVSSKDRLQMLEFALSEYPWAEVNSWEIEQGEKFGKISYSWQTVQHLLEQKSPQNHNPNERLVWLLGSDQWQKIEDWAQTNYLAENLIFIVYPRGETCFSEKNGYQAIFLKNAPQFKISSTYIRKNIHTPEFKSETCLNPKVHQFILANDLYKIYG